jgi:hypothetical protein
MIKKLFSAPACILCTLCDIFYMDFEFKIRSNLTFFLSLLSRQTHAARTSSVRFFIPSRQTHIRARAAAPRGCKCICAWNLYATLLINDCLILLPRTKLLQFCLWRLDLRPTPSAHSLCVCKTGLENTASDSAHALLRLAQSSLCFLQNHKICHNMFVTCLNNSKPQSTLVKLLLSVIAGKKT